jgi:uncharacterized membrane protein
VSSENQVIEGVAQVSNLIGNSNFVVCIRNWILKSAMEKVAWFLSLNGGIRSTKSDQFNISDLVWDSVACQIILCASGLSEMLSWPSTPFCPASLRYGVHV